MGIVACPDSFANMPCPIQKVDSRIKFVLEVKNEIFLQYADTLCVKYIRDDWRMADDRVAYLTPGGEHLWQNVPFTLSGNTLSFELEFKGEYEHWIGIRAKNGNDTYQDEYFFYTLEDDLLRLDAYKGNVHSHSTGSDGLFPPEKMPFYMRKAGFDFTAVTDHKTFDPTWKAVESSERFDSGLHVYCGEEAESYGVGINHILSIGSASSISKWEYDPESDFAQRAEKVEQELLAQGIPAHEAKYAGQFEAITSRIKEEGGLSVFCHPYWKQNSRYASTTLLTDILMKRGNFDALELGNFNVPRMALCNAKVMEAMQEGFAKPFIGSSDYHGRPSQKADKDYTVIFSNGADFASFREAVLDSRCVAVGGCDDEFPFGSFRLVKYALFLMEHYFKKIHDPLCAEQGELLLHASDGEEGVLPQIIAIKEKLEEERKRFFGRNG
ncbi:MAG: hypothetical protein J6S53_10290 [Lentisphaeria bacterium]|nr:hypothetical protein [Lentisphaeria bacterium]